MRDLTKSMLSYSWAMSLFGVQQTMNVLTPRRGDGQRHQAAEAFDHVTEAVEKQLGEDLKATFRAGDDFQRALIDATVGLLTLQSFDARKVMQATTKMVQQSADLAQNGIRVTTEAMRQSATAARRATRPAAANGEQSHGWGPMPGSSFSNAS